MSQSRTGRITVTRNREGVNNTLLGETWERFGRENDFHGYLKIVGDSQSQIETGAEFSALQITDGLIMHA